MSGGTDAKQFARLGLRCYGFTPLRLPPGYDYYAMFHGTGERVPLDAAACHAAPSLPDWRPPPLFTRSSHFLTQFGPFCGRRASEEWK
jgi:hypothetical protein